MYPTSLHRDHALLCGPAPTADMLIAARLLVPRARAQVNGVMGLSQIIATVSGPVVGALLVGIPDIGWRL